LPTPGLERSYRWSSNCRYKKGDGRVFAGKEIDPTSYLRWTEEKSILQEYGRDNDNVVSYYDILENEVCLS